MENNKRTFKRGRNQKIRIFKNKKIIFAFLFFGIFLFASNSDFSEKQNISKNQTLKKYISQCDLGDEKSCDNLFFEYLKEKQYDKAAEIGWQNFYKGYFNTLPYMADLITTNKTKYKNCRFGLLLLESAIKSKKCEAFKILSQWYKEGRCTNKPNPQKSRKYYNFYLKCKKKSTQKNKK